MTIPDDFDARPGSVVALARTVVGLYLRRLDGWIPIAGLIRVMQQLGVDEAQTRTAVTRLKARGLLLPATRAGVRGYALNDEAIPMLEAGDRRIFQPRRMADGDPWCLVSFSIPETQRSARHQLRRRLHWIGCGTVSPALWIAPGFLADEVRLLLEELELRGHATVFEARGEIDATWWDLDEIAAAHREFVDGAEQLLQTGEVDALNRYVRGIDLWRPIPYLDPGLPRTLLPADWPGYRSEALYATLARSAAEAEQQLRALL